MCFVLFLFIYLFIYLSIFFFFNSGNENLGPSLRKECAQELSANSKDYYNHPHLLQCCKDIGADHELLIQCLLGDDAAENDLDLKAAFDLEVKLSSRRKRWSSLLHVMAMSTVIQRPIVSLYPTVDFEFRRLMNNTIRPLRQQCPPVYIQNNPFSPIVAVLWSRDGNFDNTPGVPFQPNHVVPVIYTDSLPPGFQIMAPAKKRKITWESGNSKQRKINAFFSFPPYSSKPHVTSSIPGPD